ncbi:MAG: serine/threonine-protein phosphatase [Ardenticatenaceae bacterium]|nr:serine/threonine-protein phosphatase [Anaerolineales bacterium]MCB8917544.1 serine/threonine-protein phosphatase [Ardenticatenaceae bacterium]
MSKPTPTANDPEPGSDPLPQVEEAADLAPMIAAELSPAGDEEPTVQHKPENIVTAATPNLQTMPLPPFGPIHETPLSAARLEAEENATYLSFARRSHIGSVRNRNQDSCLAFACETGGHETLPLFGLFIVADGMGGHFDGDIAGRIVSRTMADHVLQQIYLPLVQGNSLASQRPIAEVLEEAATQANVAIRLDEPGKEMGTTLTTALILGRRLYVLHVGDSRAYLGKGDMLEQITTDHSVVKALEEAGQISPEEAAQHPNRNMLYRAVMGEELEFDSFNLLLPKQGKLLLCSDGLWGLVPPETITEIVYANTTLQAKVDALVASALEQGGHDNISAILVDFAL